MSMTMLFSLRQHLLYLSDLWVLSYLQIKRQMMGISRKPPKEHHKQRVLFSSTINTDVLSTYCEPRMILGDGALATNITPFLTSKNSESSACDKLLTR